jgi:hypothetical protein
MRVSVRDVLFSAIAAAMLCMSPLAVSSARADGVIVLTSERVQVVHEGNEDGVVSAKPHDDSTNLNITFTIGDEACDAGNDVIDTGVEVALLGESCEDYDTICTDEMICPPIEAFPFHYVINPFVAHTVNHQTYGTFTSPTTESPLVTAKIVVLATPVDACGRWNLNVQGSELGLASITTNPISLWLNDEDGDGPICFDIPNAIIGTAIPPPTIQPSVRR